MAAPAKPGRLSCVIVSNRPWNRDLARRLARRSGAKFTLISRREDLTATKLRKLGPRYVFFPHWSYIIPEDIFREFECVIFHMTNLPYGRGGSPLQNLIVRGHKRTKITALRCVRELDAGPVYLKEPLALNGAAGEIYRRADAVIENMILRILKTGRRPKPQKGKATVFKRRKPEEGNLDRVADLREAYDYIRMLDAEGYPAAFLKVGPLRFEFTRAARRADAVVADVRITIDQQA